MQTWNFWKVLLSCFTVLWSSLAPPKFSSPTEHLSQVCAHSGLSTSTGGDFMASLSNLSQRLTTFTTKKFYCVQVDIHMFYLCSLVLTLSLWTSKQNLSSSSSFSPLGYLYTLVRSPWALSSTGWTAPVLSSSSLGAWCSRLAAITAALSVPIYLCLSSAGEPSTGHRTPNLTYQCWLEERVCSPAPLAALP